MSGSIDTPQAQRTDAQESQNRSTTVRASLSGLTRSKPSLRSLAVLLPWVISSGWTSGGEQAGAVRAPAAAGYRVSVAGERGHPGGGRARGTGRCDQPALPPPVLRDWPLPTPSNALLEG
jgi:hypothetical protein